MIKGQTGQLKMETLQLFAGDFFPSLLFVLFYLFLLLVSFPFFVDDESIKKCLRTMVLSSEFALYLFIINC